MAGAVLRAGAWPAVVGVSGAAVVVAQRRRRYSPNAYWHCADLLAVAGQLSTPVPPLGQVS
jgi:hypothetical protein